MARGFSFPSIILLVFWVISTGYYLVPEAHLIIANGICWALVCREKKIDHN